MFFTDIKSRKSIAPDACLKKGWLVVLAFLICLVLIPGNLLASYQVVLSESGMMSIKEPAQIFFGIVIFITLVTTLFPVAITALGLQLTISGYDNVGMCFFFTGLFLTFYGKPRKKSKVPKS
jgi:hypothetical protein